MHINAYNREQGPGATGSWAMGSVSNHQLAGGYTRLPEEAPKEPQVLQCWFLSMLQCVLGIWLPVHDPPVQGSRSRASGA